MEIQQQLILAAYIVNFGLTPVQPHNEMVDQAASNKVNDKDEIRENFQNLFNSIANNKIMKSGIHRGLLKQEVVKEHQAFDAMKEEVQIVRHRNAYKKRNFYQKTNINENFAVFKRETNENDPSIANSLPPKTEAANEKSHDNGDKSTQNNIEFLEKEFIAHLDKNESTQRTIIKTWDIGQVKALCERALNDSRQFAFSFVPQLTTNSVLFNHCTHEPVKLEVLQCPADNTFIYESRRQKDCYLIMSQKKFKNVRPIGYLYIQYERCGLGLMTDT